MKRSVQMLRQVSANYFDAGFRAAFADALEEDGKTLRAAQQRKLSEQCAKLTTNAVSVLQGAATFRGKAAFRRIKRTSLEWRKGKTRWYNTFKLDLDGWQARVSLVLAAGRTGQVAAKLVKSRVPIVEFRETVPITMTRYCLHEDDAKWWLDELKQGRDVEAVLNWADAN